MSTEEVPTKMTAEDVQRLVAAARQYDKRVKSEQSELMAHPKDTIRQWVLEILNEQA